MKVKPGRDTGGVAIELGMNEQAIPGTAAGAALAAPIFKLKRILVPVDFSERSAKAVRYAVAFARQFEAELTLLNVVQRYPQVPELAPLAIEPVDEIKQKLEEVSEPLRENVFVTTAVRTGDPSLEIVTAAIELDIDLIILSTHGWTGLKHLFMGSTAEKVVRRARCPVLIVRNEEHEFLAEGAGGN